jgi:hypothetical protein
MQPVHLRITTPLPLICASLLCILAVPALVMSAYAIAHLSRDPHPHPPLSGTYDRGVVDLPAPPPPPPKNCITDYGFNFKGDDTKGCWTKNCWKDCIIPGMQSYICGQHCEDPHTYEPNGNCICCNGAIPNCGWERPCG